MIVRLAGIEFDNVSYDSESDVLYAHVGDPALAVDWDESPEGHGLRFDSDGRLIGVTLVNARLLLKREGRLVVTLPPQLVEADDLSALLVAA